MNVIRRATRAYYLNARVLALALVLGLTGTGLMATAAFATAPTVSTATQLTAALAAAQPGQTIVLADGVYVGNFVAKAQGSSTSPITITGSRDAILSTGSTSSGAALTVTADFWHLTGFGVTSSLRGVVLLDADNTVIDGVEVATVGAEGVTIGDGSRDVIIRRSLVRNTGLTNAANGDGIAVGTPYGQWAAVTGSATTPDRSYRAIIENNEIRDTAGEAIDVREGTRDTQIRGNTLTNAGYSGQNGADSLIAIAGESSVVEFNTGSNARLDAFQVQSVVAGWGGNNVFGNNTVSAVPGYEVRINSSEGGNTVACDTTGATLGLSNVACTGAAGPAPTPTATPTVTPTPTPTPAPSNSVTVSTSAQLTAALKAAVPGQTIVMTPGTYVGKFVAATSGTSSKPITLTGPASAVLTTGSNTSGYGLHITGSNWRLTGFSVSVAQKGIVLDRSSNTVIDGVDVGKIGQEAIHVRTNSVDVIIRNSRVHDTGLSTASYGEGIYVGSAKSNWSSIMGSSSTPDRSDRVLIENNVILNTTAEGIDIKEGTTGGIVRGNSFTHSGHSGANYADSWVDVKGNGYLLEANSGRDTLLDAFQVHSVATGWGGGNLFRSNTVIDGVPGYEVRVSSSEPGNVVACASSNAALGLTNVTCT
jgi:hypothetical protein